jgi:hypothetical protein
MKRYHEAGDQRAIKRGLKERRRTSSVYRLAYLSPDDSFNKFETQRGRYRKKDAYDCGNPKCMLCHSEKILGIKPFSQKKADADFKDQLKDAS